MIEHKVGSFYVTITWLKFIGMVIICPKTDHYGCMDNTVKWGIFTSANFCETLVFCLRRKLY